jgi:hypothetical protein
VHALRNCQHRPTCSTRRVQHGWALFGDGALLPSVVEWDDR